MRISVVVFLGIMISMTPLKAQAPGWQPSQGRRQIPLWPNGVPGGQPANTATEVNIASTKDKLVAGRSVICLSNVNTPTITYYAPLNAKGDVPAVIVLPGGGYHILAIDMEGTEVCDWLNSFGVACVLLKYRVPDSGPYPESTAALQDAQRAMSLVRQHAAEWHIDARRVGVLGFSAGAHLAAALSTHFDQRLYNPTDAADKLSCRPDFAVIIYPGYLALADENFAPDPDIKPTTTTPPQFIVQAENDPVHVENALVYFTELKKAKVPAELHIYAEGGHGYGLRRTELPITAWPSLVETWLKTIHVLGTPK